MKGLIDVTSGTATPAKKKENILAEIFSKGTAFFALLILVAYLSIANPNFFHLNNFINIARQSSINAILAIGETLVIILAGIDLSVGSAMALAGSVMAVALVEYHVGVPLGILLALFTGTLAGLINGYIISKARIPDFIVTLGALSTLKGLALIVTDGLPISGIPSTIVWLGSGDIMGIPVAAIGALLVALVGWFLLNKTTFGRAALAMGGNQEAARVSGINLIKTRVLVYCFSGLCAGIASIFMVGRLNSANALMGTGMELTAIAAVIIGGTNLFGGEGSIGGTLLGVITMGVLTNGLDLLNISAFWQQVILGLVIIGVVVFDQWRRRRWGN
ncbi:ABC transporter permease [Moorella sulfitireducens]|uniref:ABC transporter permease n=1 Tax=Neomoorella sulfitireducens TaxID=2972948 RepID=UPI0021AB9C3D|nr:ABC transporter permease [Moorella sulfitireducens]